MEKLIESGNQNVDQSYANFLTKFNSILDMHALIKNISKQKLTLGLRKFVSIKNSLLTKYITLKDLIMKNETQTNYKQYRNLLYNLLRESKKSCFAKYFQNNLIYLKTTWKGMKTLISLKESPNISPSTMIDNGKSLTKPKEITNPFNK